MLDGSISAKGALELTRDAGPAPELGPARREFALAPLHAPRGRLAPGLALAFALHAAAAYALVSGSDEPFGAGGIDLEAISVEVMVVPATALESRVRSEVSAEASAAAIDRTEGGETTTAETKQAPPTEKHSEEPPKSTEPDAPPAEPKPQFASTAPVAEPPDPDAITLPPREPETKPEATAEKPPPPREPSTAATAGGASAHSSSGQDRPARAAAVASPGAIQAFARSVVDALSRTRPKGVKSSARGTAKVAFAVAEGGGLEFVRIVRSSGYGALDAAALTAIRRASFPAPPAGMALAQRTYEIPYHFR